jgi:hypothetical protein
MLMDDIGGEWRSYDSYTTFTATNDFTFKDTYASHWPGELLINGAPADNNVSLIRDFSYSGIRISNDMHIALRQKKVIYKFKSYDIDVNFNEVYRGTLLAECSFIHDGEQINLKIDFSAPEYNVKKGDYFTLSESPYGANGIPLIKLNFRSAVKVSGSLLHGDIVDNFSGTWSVNSGRLTFKINGDMFDFKVKHTLDYKIIGGELFLSSKGASPDYNILNTIPNECITDVVHWTKYKRPGLNE